MDCPQLQAVTDAGFSLLLLQSLYNITASFCKAVSCSFWPAEKQFGLAALIRSPLRVCVQRTHGVITAVHTRCSTLPFASVHNTCDTTRHGSERLHLRNLGHVVD